MQSTNDRSVIEALLQIDFFERYKSISKDFDYFKERMNTWSKDKVQEMIQSFGYKAKYNKRDNFFAIEEDRPPFQFYLNISFQYSAAEFILSIGKNGETLIGGAWNALGHEVTGSEEKVKLPTFRNYEDLHQILEKAFRIYEDFKTELLKTDS